MSAELNRLFNDIWFLVFFVLLLSSLATHFISKSSKLLNFLGRQERVKSKSADTYKKLILVFILIYIIFFGTTSIIQHYALNTHAEDLGMFTQVVWNTLHGNIAYTTLKHECFFKEHFAPIYIIISPLYIIFNTPVTLLVIQTIMLALMALPVYYIANLKLKSPLAAFALSLSYLFCPHIHCANLFDFHQEVIEGFLILTAFYLILKSRIVMACILLALAFSCKEDVSLNVIPLALLLIFKEKKKIGIPLLIISVLYFVIATKFIIPAFNSPGEGSVFFAVRYGWLGSNPFEIMKNSLLNPVKVIEHVLTLDKIAVVARMLLPIAFMNLANFWGIFLFILPLFANLLSSFQPQYTLSAHYAVVIMPFVYLGAIYGANTLDFSFKSYKTKYRLWIFVIIASILAAFAFAPHTFNMRKCKITPHKKLFYSFKKQIPEKAKLSTQVDLLPHLAHREKVYLFPEILDAEYVLIDTKGNVWPCSYEDYRKHVNKLMSNRKFKKVAEKDGYYLFKRNK